MEKYLNLSAKTQTTSYQNKFEKNPGYKNINTSQYDKPLVTKNTGTLPSCIVT